MRRGTCSFVSALPLLLLTASTCAQEIPASSTEPQPPAYKLQLNTKLVLLDVVVTNKQGAIVTNLRKDDFQVFEDKQPQTIRTLDAAFSHQTPATLNISSTEELDRAAPDAPVSIIVLDEIGTAVGEIAFTEFSLKEYLKTDGDHLKQPTMLVAVNSRRFMVLRDYTTSRKDILHALDRHYAGSLWMNPPGQGFGQGVNSAFSALMQIAEASAGHAGHKNIVWIGRGFTDIAKNTQSEDPEKHLMPTVRMCVNLLLNSRVTLYTVDPKGISAYPGNGKDFDDHGSAHDDPFKKFVNFESMAWASGGRALYGRNDVDRMIGTSMRDGQGFYTLSYRPTSSSDDPKNFRKIRVEMKDRNLSATTRLGYYAGTAAPSPMHDEDGKFNKRFVFDVASALKNVLIYDGVPMTVSRDTAAPNVFHVQVNATDLDWEQTGQPKQRAELTVIVESHDETGKLLSHSAQILHANALGAADGGPPTGSIDLPPFTVETAPPAARIRFVLRADDTGRVGAENFFLVDRSRLHDPATGLTPPKVAK